MVALYHPLGLPVAFVDPGTDFTAVLEGEAEGFGDRGCLLLDPGQRGWATDICDAHLELFGYICEYSGKFLIILLISSSHYDPIRAFN